MSLKEASLTKANACLYEIDAGGNLISAHHPKKTEWKRTQQQSQESPPRKRNKASLFKFEQIQMKEAQDEGDILEQEMPAAALKCRCKKSHCKKHYCECFNVGMACGPNCACTQCQNTVDHQERTQQKRKGKRKGQSRGKVCFCTKSNCKKNYCACYSSGVGCQPTCKCTNCKNMVIADMESHNSENIRVELESPSEIKEPLLKRQLSQRQMESVHLEKQSMEEPVKEEQIWDYLVNH